MNRIKTILRKERKKKFSPESVEYMSQPTGFAVRSPISPMYSAESVTSNSAQANLAELETSTAHRVPAYVINHNEYIPWRPEYAPGSQHSAEPRRPEYALDVQQSAEARHAEDTLAAERRARQEAEEKKSRRRQEASAQNVRRLRQLIREKYRLDVLVWSKRGVQKAMRPDIEIEASKSDAILQEILFIVNAWDRDVFDDTEEWKLAREIKKEITKQEHLLWGDLPPWDDMRARKSEDSWER